jgi:hypothetical protein
MWTRAAAMMVGTALTAAASATASPAEPEKPRTVLAVSIIDLAHVPRHVLGEAAEDATTIYDTAGVSVVWNTSRSVTCCERPADAHWVRVILQTGHRSERLGGQVRATRSTMGFTPCARASVDCQIAYIFYDRIEELSRLTNVPLGRMLGLAMAHEIGHMLLPPPSHSPEGIMRPSLELKRSILPRFTAAQADVIRARLGQRRYGSDR